MPRLRQPSPQPMSLRRSSEKPAANGTYAAADASYPQITMRLFRRALLTATLASSYLLHAQTAVQPTVPPDFTASQRTQIETAARDTLKETGVPSASVAILRGDRVVYEGAFGLAHVSQPEIPAEPSMAYPIGSISKQFTATAILLLQQQGKLSVDDPVAKYFPELTRAKDVKVRNLLTMTSGYEDFAPQDYSIPAWFHTTKPYAVVKEWASKPLDFEPGTEWQYSNTNYLLVGLIVEKVSGEPLMRFLEQHVLAPAGVTGVFNTYTQREKLRVTGYVSYALQPVREQPLEAAGWYFGDGDLAMPASSLAQWDRCLINRCLLTPASYDEMETPFTFTGGPNAGKSAGYGFGLFAGERNGVRYLEHSGEVGGFVSDNIVFPQAKAAIVVLTNEVASSAASTIVHRLGPIVLGQTDAAANTLSDSFAPELRSILTGLAQGKIDRSLFTANANSYFDDAALADFQHELGPLGTIKAVKRTRTAHRGGMEFGAYNVTFANGTVLSTDDYLMSDGKIEQLLITGKQ